MSFTEAIHLTPLEFGLILLVIALAVALFLSKRTGAQIRGKDVQTIDFEGLKEWVKESESICETFSKNLQEKRKIAKRLIAQLDEKIDQMNQALNTLKDKERPPSEEARSKDLHPLILEMADSGVHVSQIARWLRIPEGEVQLVLDLRQFGHREDLQPQSGRPPV